MKYLVLRNRLRLNLFTLIDVFKFFPQENQQSIKIQLSRFAKRGLISKIKRGLYCFEPEKINQFELASFLYQPSYISLETALNYYGLIPDVPQGVTNIALTTTKTIKTNLGIFYYTKINQPLFFGFLKVKDVSSGRYYNLALAEKALLDYLYIRKIRNISDLRLDLKDINQKAYNKLKKSYPQWVRKVRLDE